MKKRAVIGIEALNDSLRTEVILAMSAGKFREDGVPERKEYEQVLDDMNTLEKALQKLIAQKAEEHNKLTSELDARAEDLQVAEKAAKLKCDGNCEACPDPELRKFHQEAQEAEQKIAKLHTDYDLLLALFRDKLQQRFPGKKVDVRKGFKVVELPNVLFVILGDEQLRQVIGN